MLETRRTDDTVELLFKGRVVLRHRPGKPCIAVGRGEASWDVRYGNWKIGDRSRIHPLRRASVERGDSVVLHFGRGIRLSASCSGGRLAIELHGLPDDVNRVRLRLAATRSERIYGCGEQFSRVNLRGSRVPLWVREPGVGRGKNLISLLAELDSGSGGAWHRTYFPQPSFVSSDWWYCVAETDGYCRFDFSHRHHHELEFWQHPRRVVIGVTEGPEEALRSQSELIGRPGALPDWTWNGMWLGVQGGTEAIERKLAAARDAGVAVGALWVQDWVGKRETKFGRQLMWNWQYSPEYYPDLPREIAALRERGVRFLGYINPFLAIEGPLYREASERGLCVKDGSGSDYLVTVTTFPAALLDLTNPATQHWIRGIVRDNMLGAGMAGWMADYGEYLPADAVMYDGRPGSEVHNEYPVRWAELNAEAIRDAGCRGEAVFFMRAGWLGSTRHAPAWWAGDQLVDWSRNDGIASTIPAALSHSYSGGGLWHTDLGGFTSVAWKKRSRELFMRWAELAVFAPIMRSHESNRPDSNWQFDSDAETLSHLAAMTRLYTALAPYHRHVVQTYVDTGIPPIRHLAVAYPDDRDSHSCTDQYLYGPDLLVAPVLRRRAKTRRLYLPEDRWIHLWSGKEYGGGRHCVSAPLGYPAVFHRASSIHADTFREIRRNTHPIA